MKGVRKADLPAKTCPVCNRPFTWRKKWERVWDQVKYCSDRCRGNAGKRAGQRDGAS
ncbi:DUF2256 domain-containing protein [Azospirillum thiophilum]|uniref:DUF2256 domain-containing protein n=1 Tax=Azospirillum thiophilum TaxID=528244 RepID=UPI0009E555E2|nr:DUF2256 domain-containing protein [Azospirillum thiophilum]